MSHIKKSCWPDLLLLGAVLQLQTSAFRLSHL